MGCECPGGEKGEGAMGILEIIAQRITTLVSGEVKGQT